MPTDDAPRTEAERAVERAIARMHDDPSRPAGVGELARTALLSRAHFTRLFRAVTGLSPGRYYAAVRLSRAKRLLRSTSLSVARISVRVGYRSVGTFTSRFTRSVGLPPGEYRREPQFVAEPLPADRLRSAAVHGRLSCPATGVGDVFIGVFADPIAEGQPVTWTVRRGAGPYRLPGMPDGRWFLVAYPIADEDRQVGQAPVDTEVTDVRLRPRRPTDPPVLLRRVTGTSGSTPGAEQRMAGGDRG